MNQTKKCQICPRTAKKLIISHNFLLPLCSKHEKQLESKFGEIEPLTTTLTKEWEKEIKATVNSKKSNGELQPCFPLNPKKQH